MEISFSDWNLGRPSSAKATASFGIRMLPASSEFFAAKPLGTPQHALTNSVFPFFPSTQIHFVRLTTFFILYWPVLEERFKLRLGAFKIWNGINNKKCWECFKLKLLFASHGQLGFIIRGTKYSSSNAFNRARND